MTVMVEASGPAEPATTLQAARRLFGGDGAGALRQPSDSLELSAQVTEPPRIVAADLLEGPVVREHPITGDPEVGFAAFLDGIQRSRVVHYAGAVPIVHGTVAAVIRHRVERRLFTWRQPLVYRRLYLPYRLAPEVRARAIDAGWAVRDSGETEAALGADTHPFELLTRAVHAVQDDREQAERTLAEEWCRLEKRPLFLDGGLSRGDVARSSWVVGVVKSHRSLYASGDALRVVLGLRRGSRSSVVLVASGRRQPVASWYLRLHDAAGHDPMFGLVRVEVADPLSESASSLTARADQISRWVLAETTPLALPDGRWDRMVYGVRGCEEVLRALIT